ncbi:hypothetical protein FDG92_gp36 [Arthrobacter phage Jasmine]|uniref:Uncharacterized protein n=1 Tax=Arthrobacter phage Jasmine TaxID=1772302 RepID=A0A0U4JRS9_9CAUD|nr:hypothetical protein FDG92_gp36 [Arthrobacter phage Jasmine]ALY09307.1 hypothetical protein JASMINE_37 [Arthrobacter phage Jasmine]
MRFSKKIKCKGCKRKVETQQAFVAWANVNCYECILFFDFDISWVLNWWLCSKCNPDGFRFHDIDGFTYDFSWKFPFLRRS